MGNYLETSIQEVYDQGRKTDFAGIRQELHETDETGHGRSERRRYHAVEIPHDHPQRRLWKDLCSLIVVTTWRIISGRETCETRWYVSSHAPRAKALARAIRKHWSIENGQHWVLDISFGEDWRRQQARQGATNLAAVRRLAVSLLRQDKTLLTLTCSMSEHMNREPGSPGTAKFAMLPRLPRRSNGNGCSAANPVVFSAADSSAGSRTTWVEAGLYSHDTCRL